MCIYKILGVKKYSVKAIVKRLEEEGNQLSTPKSRYRTCRKKIIVDNFDEEAIRRKIYMMYEGKQHVTLDKLLVNLIKQYMY